MQPYEDPRWGLAMDAAIELEHRVKRMPPSREGQYALETVLELMRDAVERHLEYWLDVLEISPPSPHFKTAQDVEEAAWGKIERFKRALGPQARKLDLERAQELCRRWYYHVVLCPRDPQPLRCA